MKRPDGPKGGEDGSDRYDGTRYGDDAGGANEGFRPGTDYDARADNREERNPRRPEPRSNAGSDQRAWGLGEKERGIVDKASDEVSSWFGDKQAEGRRESDEHRGKGPRNYRRSDARIAEDLNDRLSEDGTLDATDIEVSVAEGEVTLAGTVTSRKAKRRAEDCAEAVGGVGHIQNNLRVKPAGGASV